LHNCHCGGDEAGAGISDAAGRAVGGDGNLRFGGWIWRYDLAPLGPSETEVRLSYDWSAVPKDVRQRFQQFPPFSHDHLDNSLTHLAELVGA
jgi:hypothetical protein